jgi:hypothetical protein
MATKTKKTTANGNVVKYDTDEDSATLRRVAAALPRDAGVDQITRGTPSKCDATLWFDGDARPSDSFFVTNHVDVAGVWVSDNTGNVAVDVELRR